MNHSPVGEERLPERVGREGRGMPVLWFFSACVRKPAFSFNPMILSTSLPPGISEKFLCLLRLFHQAGPEHQLCQVVDLQLLSRRHTDVLFDVVMGTQQ